MGTEEATPKRRWRPRFSLLTLVLGVLFVGACGGLWWRWEPWVVLRSFPLVCDGYFSAGLTPDGRRFYCQCGSGSFNNPFVQIPGNYRGLWDTSTGQPLFLAKWDPFDGSAPDDAWISTFERFSPGNRSIVVSGEDSNEQIHLGVLDAQTGCRLPLGGKEQHPIRNVDFSADGQQLLYVAYEDKLPLSAGVFDTASRNEVPLMFPAGFDAPAFRYPCGLSPDGTKAQVAGCLEDEPWMAVFDASTGRHLVNLRGNVGSADRITVLPDNRHTLLTLDGKCLLYDLETAQNTVLLSVPYAHGAMLSPDGRRVLVGEGGHESAVYDVGTRTRLFPVHGKEGYLGRMRPYWFSPDSQRLVGEQTFGRLAIRDTSKGDVLFLRTNDRQRRNEPTPQGAPRP
jgi:WD40 repeat protein